MNIIDILVPSCVVVNAKFESKDSVLKEIASKAAGEFQNADEAEIFDSLKERETLGSTGFGDGIAIPHSRLKEVDKFIVGLIAIPDGVAFDAIDEKPVRLAVFIVGPEDGSNAHIRLLSKISQALMIKGTVDEIVSATSKEVAIEGLLRHIKDDAKKDKTEPAMLMQITVQEEDAFRDILELVPATQGASALVIDSKPSHAYLAKTPLFAGFWTDDYMGITRVIQIVLPRAQVNDLVRRIEVITGELSKASGVLVTVQELFFHAGSLDA